MAIYTTTPQDDSNLDVTVTEGEVVEINIQPAAVTIVGAGEVTSVNGLTGAVVLDTDDISEGSTNLYYTTDRVDTWLGTKTTSDLTEGTNLYYTDARVNTFLTDGSVSSINFGGNTSLSWNADDGTLEFPVNADVTLQIGQEQLIHVKNESGASLSNGQVVYVTGASGSKLTVDLADSSLEGTSAATIAIMTQDLGNNSVGYATTNGLVRGLNTSAYAEGAAIYLNSNGAWSTTKPVTPDHLVPVGWIVRSHATEGSIFVHINNGQELEELHDVLITNVQDGEGIVWDSANGYWKNATISVDLTGYATEAYVDAAIPVNVSAFVNDAGYLTAETDSQTLSFANPNLSISNGNTVDLSALTPTSMAWSSITGTPTTIAGYGITDAFDGDYNSLINTPTIPTLTSELTNDSGFITSTLAADINLNGNSLYNGTTELLRPAGNALEIQAEAFGDWLNFYSNNGAFAGAVRYGVAQSSAAGFAAYVSQQTNNGHRLLDIKAVQDTGDTFDSGVHNLEYWFYGDSSNKLISSDQTLARIPLDIDASVVTIQGDLSIDGLYTFPTADGTAGQVITTDGLGNLNFTTVSGGGGALNDLSDVNIVSVADGDLLRYNGTAGSWQNTNLGLSVTPTFTVADQFAGAENKVTITNWASYDDPDIWAQVVDSLDNVVVTNNQITNLGGGEFSFTTPAVGTNYEVQVRVQDFGDLASEVGTDTFDSLVIPTHRYYRLTFINATSWNMIDRWNFYTGAGQTGTRYPTSSMTSNTAPTPFVASADAQAGGYSAYEAFDLAVNGLGGSWWNLGSSNYADSWLQLDMGTGVQISSFLLNPVANASYVNTDGWLIHSSATGAFAGEEVLRATVTNDGSFQYAIG